MNRRSGDEEDVRVRTVPRSHLQQSRDHPDADFLLISCISCLFLGASNCLTASLSVLDTLTRYVGSWTLCRVRTFADPRPIRSAQFVRGITFCKACSVCNPRLSIPPTCSGWFISSTSLRSLYSPCPERSSLRGRAWT